ncbi:hypothetical protein GCM10009527_081360 [Actinomadura nitritigenes]
MRLADGRTLHADMLDGHPGFKGSLWHEYVGVLRDFDRRVRAPRTPDGGLAALRFVRAAYHLAETRIAECRAPAAAAPPQAGTGTGSGARTGGDG